MDAAFARAWVEAQDGWVLRMGEDGRAVVEGAAPGWVGELPGWGEGVGKSFGPVSVMAFLESCWPEMVAVWRGGEGGVYRSEFWTEPKREGGELHLEATALRVESGGFLVVRRVEREYAARQQLLQLARERMLDHDRLVRETMAKEVLLHCIVHDLAGPLASIQGCLEILAREGTGAATAEFVDLGLFQVGRQNRLIKDLLDVFASQIGEHERAGGAAGEGVELGECVAGVVEGLKPAYLVKQVGVRLEISERDRGGWVAAERSRLERVLYNLMENALRYAPSGTGVTVMVEGEEGWVSVVVADEGPGVAEQVRPRLFERFVTGGPRAGKSGLGLFFCRITVERWGGSIGYEGQSGAGARFRVRLRRVGGGGASDIREGK